MKSAPRRTRLRTVSRASASLSTRITPSQTGNLPSTRGPGVNMRGRSQQVSELDAGPPMLDLLEAAAHVAHTGDAIGNEQRENGFFIGACGMCRVKLAIVHVNVHVPEAGDQEFLGSVDYLRVRRNLDLRSGPQPCNTPA